ncbi:MAG: Ig-like domain-containing protein [Candidatus Sericytochromatia bacterium]|nr:Ig-like domain-containing protein [Candidatus Sericytochromatia bacterium]
MPTTPLTASNHGFTARVVDGAGNISAESKVFTVSVDLTAPPAGELTGLTADTDTGSSETDGITSKLQPKLYGTVESYATVELLENGVKIGETIADKAGAWTISPNLGAGQHNLEIRAIDAAGNVGPKNPIKTIFIDATAPLAPVISGLGKDKDGNATDTGTSANDGITTAAKPVFQGMTEPGATIRLLEGDRLIGTATADRFGAWSVTPTEDLAAGAHRLVAEAYDVAGNKSVLSSAFDMRVDPSSPAIPVVTGFSAATDTGASPTDGTTRLSRPVILGKANPTNLVDVFVAGKLVGQTAADADGNWSLTPTTPLAEGANLVTAKATSRGSGETSVASAAFNATLDTLTPAKPVFKGLTPETTTSKTVVDLTSNRQPTLFGEAEAGSTVEVYDGTVLLGKLTAAPDNTWSLPLLQPLTAGTHTISVLVRDLAGNVSPNSDVRTFTVDFTAPAIPTVQGLTAATDLGASAFDGFTSTPTPALTGTAEAGASVEVYADKTTLLGTATANEAGVWVLTLKDPLAEGAFAISAIAVDAAGNASLRSAERQITVNTSTTSTPVVLGLSVSSDTGADPTDKLTQSARPTIVGTAEKSSTVSVYDGTKLIGLTTSDAETGLWALTPVDVLTDGGHTLTAQSENLVGRVSSKSDPVVITIDRQAPTHPTIVGLDDGAGGVAAVNQTASLTPTVMGTVPADGGGITNLTILVYSGTTLLGTTQPAADGKWSLPVTLANAAHPLTAVAVDKAGNASKASSVWSLLVDAVAPAAPTVTGLAPGFDDGLILTDSLTTSAKPTLIGRAEPGAQVTVFDGATNLGTVSADAAGNWTLALSGTAHTLSEGAHTLTAQASDAVGNQSAASLPVDIRVDLTTPGAPVVLGLAPNSRTVEGQDITRLDRVTVVGTAEAGSVVEVFAGAQSLGRATADFEGKWALATPLASGSHNLTARAQDAAGYTSPASAVVTVQVDANAPLATTVTGLKASDDTGLSASDGITSKLRPVLTGKADAGTTVSIWDGESLLGELVTPGSGTWEFTPGADLAQGAHHIWAEARDGAGNRGPASAIRLVTIDTQLPSATIVRMDPTTDDGLSNTDGVTSVTSPAFTGTADPFARVNVYVDATYVGPVTADSQGIWTVSLANKNGGVGPFTLTPGEHFVYAEPVDQAGNIGTLVGPFAFNIAAKPSNVPTDLALAAGSDTGASATDRVTALARPTITGKASANASVQIFDGDVQIGLAQADAAGVWTLTVGTEMTEGVHSIGAREVNATGALGPMSATPLSITVDRTAPTRPAITKVTVDSGSGADGGVTGDNTPQFSGTGESGTTVELFDGSKLLGQAVVSTGQWTITSPALDNGTHALTLVATDLAGNKSTSAAPRVLVVETTVPEAPTIWGLTPETDTGISSDDRITNLVLPVVRGLAAPGLRVEVLRQEAGGGFTSLGTTVADATGAWTVTPGFALTTGFHQLVARGVAATGATSANSTPVTIEVRSGTPLAATIDGLNVATDSGLPDGVTNVTRPVLEGKNAPAGARVEVKLEGVTLGTAIADATGAWSYRPDAPLKEGKNTFTVVTLDEVGKNSPASAPFTVTIDTTAPAIATGLRLTSDSDAGAKDNDGITSDTTPTIAGVAEAGASIVVTVGDVRVTAVALPDGSWTATLPTLKDGPYAASVQVLDQAANLSDAAPMYTFTVDTKAPTQPVIAGFTPATDTGAKDTDAVTSVTRPVLTGRAEAGATVEIYEGAILLGVAVTDETGTWAREIELGLGAHELTAKAIDVAGNVSLASATKEVQIVEAAPVPYRIDVSETSSLWLRDFDAGGEDTPAYVYPSAGVIGLADVLTVAGPAALPGQQLEAALSRTLGPRPDEKRLVSTESPLMLPADLPFPLPPLDWTRDVI